MPPDLHDKLEEIAANRHVSVNHAIIDLLKDGVEAYERRRKTFFELANRFREATDPTEIEQLRTQLAQMTFGG